MTQCHKKEEVVKLPKETFFNLNVEKKEKIEEALETEFSRVTFDKASISNIIEQAKIPRGSFYQYFDDKEDAIKYIVQKYIKLEAKTMKNFLRETNGDIFDAALKIFDYMTSRIEEPKRNLYKNIIQELKKNNINLFSNENFECNKDNDSLIDTSKLNLKDQTDLKYMLKIISTMVQVANSDVGSGRLSKEKARRRTKKTA